MDVSYEIETGQTRYIERMRQASLYLVQGLDMQNGGFDYRVTWLARYDLNSLTSVRNDYKKRCPSPAWAEILGKSAGEGPCYRIGWGVVSPY